ncbi:cell wall glucanase [Microthyrium microscopicum]|uniref:chitinase n=1 Tax=Microthyrium microscopicum TaxID=703497 RepID=A0A6A6TZP9_9PEZI|nr:cell wall glucanase [Microthyrium microscopicum]
MSRLFRSAVLAIAAFGSAVLAQTSTTCNPLNSTCPADEALGQYADFDFTSSVTNPSVWNQTSTPITFGGNGSVFSIAKHGDSPTMNTNFYIMWGSVSVVMRCSDGPGIVSSIVLLSDDLDEIDWEILGSNKTHVETNYFGKGNTTTYNRAIYYPVSPSPQDNFHNYTITWTKDKLEWLIDGRSLRTLNYGDALGGQQYPQTPMKIYLGAWAAGDPAEPKGVQEWAEATTDYTKGPWTMNVKNVYIQDGSTGAEYSYGDMTGSYQSIKTKAGTSLIVQALNTPIGPGAHWRALSPATRAGIIIGSIAGFALFVLTILFLCIRSTRKGLKEAAKADAEWEAQQKEAVEWQKRYNADRASTIGSQKSLAHYR